jgi:hypothetical protein
LGGIFADRRAMRKYCGISPRTAALHSLFFAPLLRSIGKSAIMALSLALTYVRRLRGRSRLHNRRFRWASAAPRTAPGSTRAEILRSSCWRRADVTTPHQV